MHESFQSILAVYRAVARTALDHPIVGAGQPVAPADKSRPAWSKFEAWNDFLRHARWKPASIDFYGFKISLGRGQLLGGYGSFADRWNWTEKRVRSFTADLIKHGMLDTIAGAEAMEYAPAGKDGSRLPNILRLVNYDAYQYRPRTRATELQGEHEDAENSEGRPSGRPQDALENGLSGQGEGQTLRLTDGQTLDQSMPLIQNGKIEYAVQAGQTLGQGSGQTLGQTYPEHVRGSGQTLGQTPGQTFGQTPTPDNHLKHNENSEYTVQAGHTPGRTPGQTSGQVDKKGKSKVKEGSNNKTHSAAHREYIHPREAARRRDAVATPQQEGHAAAVADNPTRTAWDTPAHDPGLDALGANPGASAAAAAQASTVTRDLLAALGSPALAAGGQDAPVSLPPLREASEPHGGGKAQGVPAFGLPPPVSEGADLDLFAISAALGGPSAGVQPHSEGLPPHSASQHQPSAEPAPASEAHPAASKDAAATSTSGTTLGSQPGPFGQAGQASPHARLERQNSANFEPPLARETWTASDRSDLGAPIASRQTGPTETHHNGRPRPAEGSKNGVYGPAGSPGGGNGLDASAVALMPSGSQPGWREVQAALQEALHGTPIDISRHAGLLDVSVPLAWLQAGADLHMDVVPTVRRLAVKGFRSWQFCTGAVTDAIATRRTAEAAIAGAVQGLMTPDKAAANGHALAADVRHLPDGRMSVHGAFREELLRIVGNDPYRLDQALVIAADRIGGRQGLDLVRFIRAEVTSIAQRSRPARGEQPSRGRAPGESVEQFTARISRF